MKHFFDEELNKLKHFGAENDESIRRLSDPHHEMDEIDGENVGPVVPQPAGHPRPTSASEELARLFRNAKLDLKDQLKMPTEQRFPLSSLNGN